jgi:hypothetical protein
MSPKTPGERVGGAHRHTTRSCLVANRAVRSDSRPPADAIVRSIALVAVSEADAAARRTLQLPTYARALGKGPARYPSGRELSRQGDRSRDSDAAPDAIVSANHRRYPNAEAPRRRGALLERAFSFHASAVTALRCDRPHRRRLRNGSSFPLGHLVLRLKHPRLSCS